jgi:hypothetical protein
LTSGNADKRWRQRNPAKARAIGARGNARYYAKGRVGNFRHGKLWTDGEVARVVAANRPTDVELSAELGRSIGAIQMKRLEILNPRTSKRPPGDPAAVAAARKRQQERNPEAWRAARRKIRAKNYARGAVHDRRSRRRWTTDEERQITAPDRPSDRELAKQLGRSVQAIQVKRTEMKRASALAQALEAAS